MLKRFYADNYRCFVNFEFRPEKICLLMGEGGGGKSSLFDVLAGIFAVACAGREIADVFPAHELTRWETRATQQFELDVAGNGGTYRYTLRLGHDLSAQLSWVIEEVVTFDGNPLFRYTDGTVNLFGDDSSAGPTFPLSPKRSFLPSLEPSKENTRLTWLLSWFRNISLFARSGEASSSYRQDA